MKKLKLWNKKVTIKKFKILFLILYNFFIYFINYIKFFGAAKTNVNYNKGSKLSYVKSPISPLNVIKFSWL